MRGRDVTIQIAFCEDNRQERDLLLSYTARYAATHSLHIEPLVYTSAESLLSDPDAGRSSAVFLDIYISSGGISGVEAAHILREREYTGGIVLCTVSRDHFADGFVVDASHYLLKPVEYEDFSEAMRRVLRLAGAAARTLSIRSGRDTIRIPAQQIQYAEVYGHETVLHTSSQTIPASHSLSALEDMLGGDPFLRCYRSYIVNMDYVERIDGDAFIMKSGARVPIARDGRKGVQNRYLAYVFGKMEKL